MTKTTTNAMLFVAGLCIGAASMFMFQQDWSVNSFRKKGSEVESGLGAEILFMRTEGGLLEVSKIQVTEEFSKKFVYSILGWDVGETVAHIRVPATYRYHIKLGSEWKIIRAGEVFTVITPPVQPSLPVAVDLKQMQEDSGGTWVLVPFNETSDLKLLRNEITAKLAEKAQSRAYRQLQRDDARKTVTEFAEKWLIKQASWSLAQKPRIEVVFGD